MNCERSDRYDEWVGCFWCGHRRGVRCIAYPKAIPLPILLSEVDHLVPRPGQAGDTVFTPMDVEHWLQTRERVPASESIEDQIEAHNARLDAEPAPSVG